MIEAIKSLFSWLVNILLSILGAIFDLLSDVALLIVKGILSAIAGLISALPAPDFLTGGLQSYVSLMPSSVLYFISQSGIHEAFALLGVAFLFRMSRKFVTLFQW